MKISTILTILSVTFLSYWGYNKLSSYHESVIKPELKIEIPNETPDENNIKEIVNTEENIFEDVEEVKENDPLTPLQKLVQDHFQLAHR